ncbi:hypothetical protein BJV78DRAFT_419257 [Lactifluus subvellereus]|nr:hypothetical protein BJV78DRAFT_419257 [Lactifluus subvellereus]
MISAPTKDLPREARARGGSLLLHRASSTVRLDQETRECVSSIKAALVLTLLGAPACTPTGPYRAARRTKRWHFAGPDTRITYDEKILRRTRDIRYWYSGMLVPSSVLSSGNERRGTNTICTVDTRTRRKNAGGGTVCPVLCRCTCTATPSSPSRQVTLTGTLIDDHGHSLGQTSFRMCCILQSYTWGICPRASQEAITGDQRDAVFQP